MRVQARIQEEAREDGADRRDGDRRLAEDAEQAHEPHPEAAGKGSRDDRLGLEPRLPCWISVPDGAGPQGNEEPEAGRKKVSDLGKEREEGKEIKATAPGSRDQVVHDGQPEGGAERRGQVGHGAKPRAPPGENFTSNQGDHADAEEDIDPDGPGLGKER